MRTEEVSVGGYTRIRNGRSVYVSGYTARRTFPEKASKGPRVQYCKTCGAPIRAREMPSGGFVVFEAIPGLRSVKHPCYHLGDHLGTAKEYDTLDLFERGENEGQRR